MFVCRGGNGESTLRIWRGWCAVCVCAHSRFDGPRQSRVVVPRANTHESVILVSACTAGVVRVLFGALSRRCFSCFSRPSAVFGKIDTEESLWKCWRQDMCCRTLPSAWRGVGREGCSLAETMTETRRDMGFDLSARFHYNAAVEAPHVRTSAGILLNLPAYMVAAEGRALSRCAASTVPKKVVPEKRSGKLVRG